MIQKEVKIRESQNFMKIIKNTEDKINRIVDKSEKEHEIRKEQGIVNDFEMRRRQEYEQRMKKLVDEREMQYKDYNEQLREKIVDE